MTLLRHDDDQTGIFDIIICVIYVKTSVSIIFMIIDRMEPGFNSNHIRTQDIYERFSKTFRYIKTLQNSSIRTQDIYERFRFSKTFLFYQNMKLFKTESDTGESTFLLF